MFLTLQFRYRGYLACRVLRTGSAILLENLESCYKGEHDSEEAIGQRDSLTLGQRDKGDLFDRPAALVSILSMQDGLYLCRYSACF